MFLSSKRADELISCSQQLQLRWYGIFCSWFISPFPANEVLLPIYQARGMSVRFAFSFFQPSYNGVYLIITIFFISGRECSVAPKEKSCYRCGAPGHISRECPQSNGGGGDDYGTEQECYKCGQVGHIARSCPQQSYGGYGGYGGGGRAQTCYSCGGYGHMARDCTQGQKCYNCGFFFFFFFFFFFLQTLIVLRINRIVMVRWRSWSCLS